MPAFASERLTVSSSVVTLTSGTYAPSGSGAALSAIVTVEDDAIRFTLDGTTPTASRGHKVAAGGSFILFGYSEVAGFKAIRVTGDAPIEVTYKR